MSDVRFDPASLQRSAEGMQEAADDLVAKTRTVLSDCGDLSALGTNDTLGGIAKGLYAAVLERIQETVESLSDEAGGHGEALSTAARLYRDTEDTNSAAASSMVEG